MKLPVPVATSSTRPPDTSPRTAFGSIAVSVARPPGLAPPVRERDRAPGLAPDSLPPLVDERLRALLVELADPVHRRRREWRQVRRCRVRPGLVGRLRAGDGGRHLVGHEDPPQRQLGERGAVRHERAQFLHELQPRLVVEAGERLPDVEGFAVAVERAVVAGIERSLARERAGQEARREGHPGQDADVAAGGLGQEAVSRALADQVVDDLDARDARVLDRLERLLDALNADAVRGHGPLDELVAEGSMAAYG